MGQTEDIHSTFFLNDMIGLMLTSSAQPRTYTFSPGLIVLDHYTHGKFSHQFQAMGISQEQPFSSININDWTIEDDDIIYKHLLDTTGVGVTSGENGQGDGDNFF